MDGKRERNTGPEVPPGAPALRVWSPGAVGIMGPLDRVGMTSLQLACDRPTSPINAFLWLELQSLFN